MARLEALQIGSRHRLVGRFGGEHASKRYGNTVDFADFREYHPGDDYRNIDYHVMARLDQVLIKLFEADDEITVRVLIDTSASMATGGKMEYAKRLAAALGFVALTANDSVSIHTFNAPVPRFAGRASIPAMLRLLETLEAGGPTPLARAGRHLLSQSTLPGVIIVISDFLTEDWASLVNLRATGSDVLVVHLLCPEDIDPDYAGDVELLDRETGTRLTVSMTDDVASTYRDRVDSWRAELKSITSGSGGIYLPVSVDDPLEEVLFAHWRRSGVLR